ncbi:secondary thiamine-phosphate synthase enzyme YjbQ [Fervidobacterium thailandense]|uniref:YjbQ family protein n=1 Tax=Fervidobacterium thailandense TaxID=1008305 RepID=A0A1E3G2X5_9BACT|nr:secondary thiamine-phosphate synthase enzyme YjbQ [Fervidobacterium thailandense]ODN30636.1 hypothetical protein A4H02_03600 [Fervidobacterium thailandense]
MLKKFEVNTARRVEFVDITSLVRQAVVESGVGNGICVVYVPHTTCGITINEHADPDVVADIVNRLGELVPKNGKYAHVEGNSDAHIKASLVGSSQTIIIQDGKLLLGIWQGVFLCEFDGPRRRNVFIKIIAG